MLSWQVGRVKITRIVAMDLPVPALMVIPQATPEELRRIPWLYPHFVSEDDATLKLSVHALHSEQIKPIAVRTLLLLFRARNAVSQYSSE